MTESGHRGSAQGGPAGPTLLVVDDEPFILSTLARFFEYMLPGSNVRRASTAAQGLVELQKGHVDLIVSDYRMPDMDGIEFLVRCKMVRPLAARVLFTAYIDPAIEEEARRRAEITAFVSKLEEPMRLLDTVRKALASVPAASPLSQAPT
ncbi:MAG: response regulator [Thermoplasmatota archaeon]|nr:response regulator [Halobacteriales archaeon]